MSEAARNVSEAAVNTDEVSPPPLPLKRRFPEVASNVNFDYIDTHEVPPPRQCPGIWSHGSVHEDRLVDTLFEAAAVGCVDCVHSLVIFRGVDLEQPGTMMEDLLLCRQQNSGHSLNTRVAVKFLSFCTTGWQRTETCTAAGFDYDFFCA